MTISSSIEGQIGAAVQKQAQNSDAKASQKQNVEAKPAETTEAPAVIVDAASPKVSAPDEKLAAPESSIASFADALKEAQSIGASLSQETKSIANQSADQVAGMLSEFEAAVG